MAEALRKPMAREVELVTIPGTKVSMERLKGPRHTLVPDIDDDFYFRPELVEEIAFCVEHSVNCMITGETGSGKSTTVRQLAAFLNRPLRNPNLHGESDSSILIGRDHPTLVNGKKALIYKPGILAKAMMEGHWFCADEWDAALQPVIFAMQSALEEHPRITLEDHDGTVIRPSKGFWLSATANTVGIASRNKLRYTGTNRTNEATLDRFGCVIHVDYMEKTREIDVICKKIPNLDKDFVRAIVEIANEVRHQLKDEQLSCSFSTRRCIDWARAMMKFGPMRSAKLAVLNKLSFEDSKVIEGVIQRVFGTK